MTYPRKLYKEKTTVKLKQTSKPTGMLGYVFSDKQFLMIEPAEAEITPEKKILVLADPLFPLRSMVVSQKLDELKKAGFRILVLVNQQLTEWEANKKLIASIGSYVNHKTDEFTPEYLNKLIYEQKKLRAVDV